MTSNPFAATFDAQSGRARPPTQRDAILADPGFGNHFTDHMFLAEWTPDTGWDDARVVPYGPLSIDPATAVLHYAQEIFEGLKAYVHADGSVWLFRPEANAARMQRSAHRLALPELPTDWFLGSIEALIDGRSRLGPRRWREEPVPAAVHVRLRGLPRRPALAARDLLGHRLARGRLLRRGSPGRSRSGCRASTRAPEPAAPVRPSAAATTPRACSRSRRPPSTAARRSRSSTRSSTSGSRSSAG